MPLPLLEYASFAAGLILGIGFTITAMLARDIETSPIRSSPSPNNDDEEAWKRLLEVDK